MVAVPFATAVTRPNWVTVATAGFVLEKEIAAPAMGAPFSPRALAVSCNVSPRLASGPEVGEVIAIEATADPSSPQAVIRSTAAARQPARRCRDLSNRCKVPRP